ncbi:hypothetical protein [Coleofasciculus sp. E1-EBD-02]|uniref:hypothetical protein n=1 Tax=Coleofasciculus sp. E1-EBD-02 TaxID=3068481 RepID=UPI003301D943
MIQLALVPKPAPTIDALARFRAGFFFPVPCSLFPVPCSLFPVPCSLFPVPCSLFPVPMSSPSQLKT